MRPTPTTASFGYVQAGTANRSEESGARRGAVQRPSADASAVEEALVLACQADREMRRPLGQSVIRDRTHDHALRQQRRG